MNATHTHPGNIIWKQLTLGTKMACGAREPMLIGDAALKFRVLERNRWIEIVLDPSDTYTVRLVSLSKRYERKIHSEMPLVFADSLNETVYGMVNR